MPRLSFAILRLATSTSEHPFNADSQDSGRGNGCAKVSLTLRVRNWRSHAYRVCSDDGRNLKRSKRGYRADDRRSSSRRPCGARPCTERSRHWRTRLGPNIRNALARWGHADAHTADQQHAVAKQRRSLSAHPRLTQSGAERCPTECGVAGADTARRSYSGAGTLDGSERGSERPKSRRQRYRRVHQIVGPTVACQQTGLGASVRAQSSWSQKTGPVTATPRASVFLVDCAAG